MSMNNKVLKASGIQLTLDRKGGWGGWWRGCGTPVSNIIPGLCLVQQGQESRLCCGSQLLLALLAALLLLRHVPAEVVKDLAPLFGLVDGLVAGVAQQLG